MREVLLTSPGLVRTTPGLVKTTLGLVKTTPGLVEKTRHLPFTFSHPKRKKITADSNSDGGGVSRSQQADIFTMTPHKFFNFTLFYRLNLSKRKKFLIFI